MRKFFAKKPEVKEQIDFEEAPKKPEDATGLELTRAGPYEIVGKIGEGGMGKVYKAIDRAKDVTVAIKVLDRRYDVDRRRRRQDYLGREILIASALRHPNIIRISEEIIEQEDLEGNIRRCLIMEFIDGHNLRDYINERKLTCVQMVDLCVRICHGLDFLHQNGVVHRDIKPENFLFSRDMKEVKICDFGLSKASSSWKTRFLKEAGGTKKYMSPEQLAKKNLDARSDIFSLGITMYELLSGKHPCTGRDGREIMRQLSSSSYKFEPPSKFNPDVSPLLDKVVLKALRRSPEKRYQSVTEMLLDLSRVANSRI